MGRDKPLQENYQFVVLKQKMGIPIILLLEKIYGFQRSKIVHSIPNVNEENLFFSILKNRLC